MPTETKIYEELIGQTFSSVRVENENSELIFEKPNGDKYVFYHGQDCCENVEIKEIVGELSDLENSPILKAEETVNTDEREICSKYPDNYDSVTWTFYKFATIKGYVDVSWIGESNGYYSESVDFLVDTENKRQKEKIKRLETLVDYYKESDEKRGKKILEMNMLKSDINHSLGQTLDYLNSKVSTNDDLIPVKKMVEELYDITKKKQTFITG